MSIRQVPAVLAIIAFICGLLGAAPLALGQVAGTSAEASTRQAFWTKYAYFVPVRFDDLPGWRDDKLVEAWKAFQASCSVLATRSFWSGPCRRADGVNTRNESDIRKFIESEFALYQIHNKDGSPAGVITGYYEPLLRGSRRYGERYIYPVYGVPEDLLYLDSRTIPSTLPGSSVFARAEGRTVVVCVQPAAACRGSYKLELGDTKPDIRDKKLRVRIERDRIVPYYTRAEIEQGALVMNKALVWVDDPAALYAMHVQGSGKIRLPDGQIIRLSYAEQNGYPFTPPVQTARRSAKVLTRGIDIGLSVAEAEDAIIDPADVIPNRGLPIVEPAQGVVEQLPVQDAVEQQTAPVTTSDENASPEVERMVELLLKGNTVPQRLSQSPNKDTPQPKPPAKQQAATTVEPTVAPIPPRPSVERPSTFSSDPSYVFFRQVPDTDDGPPGALGVPLTPGRSVAVDPRTTPLGFPVFISTDGQGVGTQLNRLMLAQDTGGAIRGPVRADYFWGFGPTAGDLASRMKQYGRMWLLVPKDLQLPAAAPRVATRGIGGSGPDTAECVVPDAELCVE
jgi:membrane-bound lytic murein transglycosylase A